MLVDYAKMLETGIDVRHDKEVMQGMNLSATLKILAPKFYGPQDLKDDLLSELDKDSENCDIKSAKSVHNIICKYLLKKGFSKKPAVTIRNDVLSECKVSCKKMNFGFRNVAGPIPGGLASNFMDQKTYNLMLKDSKPADFTTFYDITGKGAIYLNDEHYGDDIWWGQGSMHVENNKNFFGIGTNRRYRKY